MEIPLGSVSWTRVQFPPPPHFRGKPDDDYDVESYLYVEGELIRVKGPNDKMPQLTV